MEKTHYIIIRKVIVDILLEETPEYICTIKEYSIIATSIQALNWYLESSVKYYTHKK